MYKILIIEDEDHLRESVSEFLRRSGFEIFSVTEFNNVMRDFCHFNPDLVLMDVNLPTLDGYYWCQKIRDHSTVPIILTSSKSTRMDVVMGIDIGANDYFYKPYELNDLLAKVNFLLSPTEPSDPLKGPISQ